MKYVSSDLDLSRVLEAASESILVTTSKLDEPGPTIVYANPAFVRMTGWELWEILGRSPRILQGEKTDLSIFNNMKSILRSGGRWEGMTVNYKKDGSEFVMEWSINPLSGSSEDPEFYVAVQGDVSVRVENELQLERARQSAREADRRKLNLARYFSPKKVEMLAERDRPLGPVRRQKVAILIIDIIGFTAMSEALPPERVVKLLRSFYGRMSEIIFRNEGSIENFAGDSLLAVFGAPDEGVKDASNAVACAVEMSQAMKLWNTKRQAAGRSKIGVGISAHFGAVVLGDIGTEKSMSFTMIGDPVNTTSRLQNLCRTLGSEILVTQDLLDRASAEKEPGGIQTTEFIDRGFHTVKGREQPVRILSLDEGSNLS